MAWTWASEVVSIGAASSGSAEGAATADAEEKSDLFGDVVVPANQAAWWRDYAWAVRQEFIRRCLYQSLNVATVQVTATGVDLNGLGQLTIAIVTS